ncbi:hypothetical protein ACIBI9_06045 [Nonomuraea sp. NPDC050451]|uniref:hypothetical protein n=1 Tax=Nonomuraea sp. NPDC050451 TaxID=3364364 RepID=UPI00379C7EFC
MSNLLSELGKKLAERWLSLLVLPGALYLAVAFAATALGHKHAFDVPRLTRAVGDQAASPSVASTGGQVVVLLAVLGAAAALGLAAQSLGSLWERVVLAAGWQSWPGPFAKLAGALVGFRRRRWDNLSETVREHQRKVMSPGQDDRPNSLLRRRTAQRRLRIAAERPERPTWSGDRIQAVALRLDRQYHLDLFGLWPHLWLVLPESVRAEVTAARTDLSRAATLAGWAVLYLPLAWWWWPAALVGAVVAAVARHRFRVSADAYAQSLEAAARVHAVTLATELGVEHTGPLNTELGDRLYGLLTPPPPD